MDALTMEMRAWDMAGRSGMAGMGYVDDAAGAATTDGSSFYTDFGATLTDLAKAASEYQLQSKALDINLERARQGLPPLDLSQYGAGVQVGLNPGTQNTLLLLGAAAIGAMILPKLLK